MSRLVVASRLPVFGSSSGWNQKLARFCSRLTSDAHVAVLTVFVLTLPCLVYRYLPMVDLPQHEAVVSMMLHLGDRGWNFWHYYGWAPTRTLYLMPYFLTAGLAHIVPLHRAINVVAFLATIAYPLGALLYLRALRRPAWIGLLALPIIYNQSFFWGFINFNLSIGLALVTVSLMVGTWSTRKFVFVSGLTTIIALTHLYGLLLLSLYVGLWLLSKNRHEALRRLPALLPVPAALVAWFVLMERGRGFAAVNWRGWSDRWSRFPEALAGGWQGHGEAIVLLLLVLIVAVFFNGSLPLTRSRWKMADVHQRLAWLLVGINLVLYFAMPELPLAATKSSFRHAQLAMMTLPLALNPDGAITLGIRVALTVLALSVIGLSWRNFHRFDAEACSFDAVIDAIPPRVSIAQLTFDRRGRVANVPVYLHFSAYAQANNGGLLAVSFPARFWNMPIKSLENSGAPVVPNDLEWDPRLFNERALSSYFDFVVLRVARRREPRLPEPFPYKLQLKSGPWWLFRKCEQIHDEHRNTN